MNVNKNKRKKTRKEKREFYLEKVNIHVDE